jgi:alkaline phosphatase D
VLRRGFLLTLFSGLLVACMGGRLRSPATAGPYSFDHGVASGDPLAEGVILWTRVSGASGETVSANWRVADDSEMRNVLSEGVVSTGSERDYTVKADVRGLPSGAVLYYQFEVDGRLSGIGRTRTLPKGRMDQCRMAVVSCSNYAAGYFHAYREIAKREDLDVVIHLGDFIYDYGPGEYATEFAESMNRVPDPPQETISLSDYRQRYAQYKSDPDAMAMQAACPMIAIWDDHEIANDAWRDGAENHNIDEGVWLARVEAAVQAYFEWMPIRGEANGIRTRIFRKFQFGDLVDLVMLDTRMFGRDVQPDVGAEVTMESVGAALADAGRRLLGGEQEEWLRDSLKSSKATVWQVIGQQVMVSGLKSPDLEPLIDPDGPTSIGRERLQRTIAMSKSNPSLLLDTWDGYPIAREDFLSDLKEHAINPVVLSGDLHTSLAGNLLPAGSSEPVAVEFMTPSVTSPGFAEYLPEYQPGSLSAAALALNPALKYMEAARRGWLCMTLNRAECVGEWHLLDGIRSQTYLSTIDRRLTVKAGDVSAGLLEA